MGAGIDGLQRFFPSSKILCLYDSKCKNLTAEITGFSFLYSLISIFVFDIFPFYCMWDFAKTFHLYVPLNPCSLLFMLTFQVSLNRIICFPCHCKTQILCIVSPAHCILFSSDSFCYGLRTSYQSALALFFFSIINPGRFFFFFLVHTLVLREENLPYPLLRYLNCSQNVPSQCSRRSNRKFCPWTYILSFVGSMQREKTKKRINTR